MIDLLPRDALEGQTIGLSVSDGPDLERLGFLDTHIHLAVGEIARAVFVAGGRLAYGGHLGRTGFTRYLMGELERYGRNDRPFVVLLSLREHRKRSLSELLSLQRSLGLKAEIVCLDRDGHEIPFGHGRGEHPKPVVGEEERRAALTGLRKEMARRTSARVLIGGKRHGFSGLYPGLVEEAILTLEAGRPIYCAGGFGGVTYDIAVALGLDDGGWLPPRPDASEADPRMSAGLARLQAVARDRGGVRNGLSAEENRRLAASHRPSDIAALVSLGLGRLQVGGQPP